MIGQRFRPLGWVAGVATAATCLYMVSLQVAAERGKLESVEHQIASAQRDMRQLQTELGTRASLRQLEKWNGDVLALSAPKAQQFLHGEKELASLGSEAIDDGTPNAPPSVMNASFMPVEAAPAEPKIIQAAVVVPVHARAPKNSGEPANVRAGFQRAIFQKPTQPARVQRVAMLDARILRDIDQSAEKERRKRP
ncbi:MAG: hypothetical protein JWO15_259 [Sphingomonadales bacterium]|nr:hypothetical protein [Sphingomonadales bacterium]